MNLNERLKNNFKEILEYRIENKEDTPEDKIQFLNQLGYSKDYLTAKEMIDYKLRYENGR